MPTKRGNSWQGIVYHTSLPTGRARRNFETKVLAENWEMESKIRLRKGEPIDMGDSFKVTKGGRKSGQPYTLLELVEYAYKNHWAPMNGGLKAIANARQIVKIIGPNLPITALKVFHINDARAELLEGEGNSTETVNRKVAALSKAFSLALEAEIITSKPLFPKYKKRQGRVRRFTQDEEKMALMFFNQIGHPEMLDYIQLGLDTGLRQGELLGLHFSRNLQNPDVVTVWGTGTKSGKSRSVPLTARAKAILKRRREGFETDAVFPDMDRWRVRYLWGRMRDALDLEGDPQFVPHILRHEFCSRLADHGENAPVIQQLAGHSSLTVTQQYIHIKADHLASAIRRLDPVLVD